MRVLLTITTIVLTIIALAGCSKLTDAGTTMESLRSQAGNTVAEIYYQNMGVAFIGFGQIGSAIIVAGFVFVMYFIWSRKSKSATTKPVTAESNNLPLT